MIYLDFHEDSPNTQAAGLRLLYDPFREAVERAVSEQRGTDWRVKRFRDLKDYSSHPCAILTDGIYPVFAKLSEAANGLDQFEVELAGLRYLSEQAGILTPNPIGTIPVEGGSILALEAVQSVERTPDQWRQIGQTLAQIHRIKWDKCGFLRQGYFGPLYQDNRPIPDWLTFFAERRLWPRLMAAIDSGNLPSSAIRQVERLIQRLPGLDIPEVVPTLLHGDAQQNNFISTEKGTVVIDPAVYYGNTEVDLALVDYFEPVPEDVFTGYQEEMPIEAGFVERRDLWRIPAYLAIISVDGAGYLDKLTNAVQKYL